MKFAAKLSATALAGLMALSMTACGAASNNATTPGYNNRGYTNGTAYNGTAYNDAAYNGSGVYRYTGPADNKGNVRRNMNGAANNRTGTTTAGTGAAYGNGRTNAGVSLNGAY